MIIQKFIVYLFYQVLYLSIIGTGIGLTIILIRKFINKKISPFYNWIIWLVFIIALIFPISAPSRVSIYNFIDVVNIRDVDKVKTNDILNLSYKVKNNDGDDIIKQRMKNNNKKIDIKYFNYIISDIWFIIFVIKLSKEINIYRLLKIGFGNDIIEGERINKIVEECKSRLNIKKHIKVIRQDVLKSPAITGIFDVKLLFSDDMLDLDDGYLTNIVMHELSHYKRKDNFLNIIIMILKSIYWFNPITNKLLVKLKTDMELATDEMAIKKLENIDLTEYCKVILCVAAKCNTKPEIVLGFDDARKTLEERIDMVLMNEEFERRSRQIMISTIVLVLLMWFVLYPSCYGMFIVPKLYLCVNDCEKIKIERITENSEYEVIKIKQSDKVKLLTEGAKSKDYIPYSKTKLNDTEISTNIMGNAYGNLENLQVGEYLYEFVLEYGYNKCANYAIKIVIE